jgi:folylpolyglutamate synthase/dihydropteroate synthase
VNNQSARSLHFNLLPKPLTVWVQPPQQQRNLSLPGVHQQDNAATAAAALAIWAPQLDPLAMQHGFASATLEARCQLVVHHGRHILIDGAHNSESLAATLRVAQQQLKPGWRLIFALAKDKDIEAIIPLIPAGMTVTRCGYQSIRARQKNDWPIAAQKWPWCSAIEEALAAQPLDVDLCITGSFYLAGEALAILAPSHGLAG